MFRYYILRAAVTLGALGGCCILVGAGPSFASGLTESEQRGKAIYFSGTSPTGDEITAAVGEAGFEIPAATMPCVNCHGYDGRGQPEGGVVPSNLTWPVLTNPHGVRHASGRDRPPYDQRLLTRAISMGIDAGGTELHVAMPRYRLTHDDMSALIAYLRRLGTESDAGLSRSAIGVGVFLPPDQPLGAMAQATRAVLEAYVAEINEQGGIYSRRVDLRFSSAPTQPEARASALTSFLASGEVFALVSAFIAGAEDELHRILATAATPLVAPVSLHQDLRFPLNPYVFYLLPGIEQQASALVDFAADVVGEEQGRAAIVHPRDPRFEATLEAIAQACMRAGLPKPEQLAYTSGTFDAASTVERLEAVGTDSVFFLGSAQEQAALLEQAEQRAWYPRLLIPGALASARLLEAAARFDGRIFVAWSAPPLGERLANAQTYLGLSAKYDLPRHHISTQLDALAGALVLVEGLKRAGRDLSHQRLVAELEGLRALETGIVPLISYGPNRRQGVRACRITAADLTRKTFVPAGHS